LDELVKSGFLKDYLQEPQGAPTSATPGGDQGHDVPIHGPDVDLVFVKADRQDVVPYGNGGDFSNDNRKKKFCVLCLEKLCVLVFKLKRSFNR